MNDSSALPPALNPFHGRAPAAAVRMPVDAPDGGRLAPTDVCEREALHRSGAIQPHGALLVIAADGLVSHASANVADALGPTPGGLLGRPPPALLAQLAEHLDAAAGAREWVSGVALAGGGRGDVVLARDAAGAITVEVHRPAAGAPAPDDASRAASPAGVEPMWDEDDADAPRAPRQALVERIMALTGFARVMYYEFVDGGDGVVQAEARDAAVYGSYLGLRFPAGDIPNVARAMYASNPWRLIPDATAEPLAVLGTGAAPPDLTHCDLRSVSPVHRAYLHNMHVVASLSLPVFIKGELSALIACHHPQPLCPAQGTLRAAARCVESFNLRLSLHQSQRGLKHLEGLDRTAETFRQARQRHPTAAAAWPALGPLLMAAFGADGAVLIDPTGAAPHVLGQGLPGAALDAVLDESQRDGGVFWQSSTLGARHPGLAALGVAGALTLSWSDGAGGPHRIVMLRREVVHDVEWGGRPDKPVERLVDGVPMLSPRHSFERWIEHRTGHSRPWINLDTMLAYRLRRVLVSQTEAAPG